MSQHISYHNELSALHTSTHNRLLSINCLIRLERKKPTDIDGSYLTKLKEFRRQSDKLLSSVSKALMKSKALSLNNTSDQTSDADTYYALKKLYMTLDLTGF